MAKLPIWSGEKMGTKKKKRLETLYGAFVEKSLNWWFPHLGLTVKEDGEKSKMAIPQ